MENEIYSVYARVRADGAVIEINSSAFLHDATGWTEIDEGTGDRFHHASGNYLDTPIFTEAGVPAFKLENGAVIPRTAEEIAAEVAALPPAPASVDERLDELYAALDMILTGVTE